ncbi:MAG: right-handed parallel beta-helix repeat-containing protein [bacterium]|nr:right-handed parallel beta-helix repeat-containing protein [bacterium]
MRIARLPVVVGLCFLFALPGVCEEGRVPIFEPVTLDGTATTLSSKYVVTRDIAAQAFNVTVIRLIGTGTEKIDIDLNGFSLAGFPNGDFPLIDATNVASLTIRNGFLFNPTLQNCVTIDSASVVVLEDLKVQQGDAGLYLFRVADFSIRRNQINGANSSAIYIANNTGSRITGVIENNSIRTGGQTPILIQDASDSVLIRDNRILASSNAAAIRVNSGRSFSIVGNKITGGSEGIALFSGSDFHVLDNTVTNGQFGAISLNSMSDGVVQRNVVSDYLNGIELSGSSRINLQNNNASNNFIYGIFFNSTSADNTYGRNVARGNGGGGCAPQNAAAPCAGPDVCDQGTNNSSFGDNMGPGPGC